MKLYRAGAEIEVTLTLDERPGEEEINEAEPSRRRTSWKASPGRRKNSPSLTLTATATITADKRHIPLSIA